MKLVMRMAKYLVLFSFMFLASFASSSAWAAPERLFGPEDLRAWAVQGNGAMEAGQERVILKGKGLVTLIPPEGMDIRTSGTVLGLRVSAGKDALLTVYVRSKAGIFPERVNIRGHHGNGPALYRFVIDEDAYGQAAELAAIEVRAAEVHLGVHSVTVKPASGIELASAVWESFWRPDYINAATITTVATPLFMGASFQIVLFFIVALLIPIFLYAASKARLTMALQTALLFAFIAAGLLFSARMDYNWLVAWGDEAGKLSGRGIVERVKAVNNGYLDDLLEQADYMRRNLPEGAEVRLAGAEESSRLASIGRYYLLPVRTSADARYIWIYRYGGLSLDKASMSLMKDGKVVASPVRLVKDFGGGSAVFVREGRP